MGGQPLIFSFWVQMYLWELKKRAFLLLHHPVSCRCWYNQRPHSFSASQASKRVKYLFSSQQLHWSCFQRLRCWYGMIWHDISHDARWSSRMTRVKNRPLRHSAMLEDRTMTYFCITIEFGRFHFPGEINCIVSSSNMAYAAGVYC